MDNYQSSTIEQYIISCYYCKNSVNTLKALWCNCLVSEPTIVCPKCMQCFCKAAPAYKQTVWANAPKSFWDRKWKYLKAEFTPKPNLHPSNIKHPLVLVVDDDKNIQRVAVKLIESIGYGVIIAQDGEQGLSLAKRFMPDLILTDALMPKLDGRELCKRIKEDSTMAYIKVIVMTSLYTSVKYKIEAYKKFLADDYLSKPLDFDQMRIVLHKYLHKVEQITNVEQINDVEQSNKLYGNNSL